MAQSWVRQHDDAFQGILGPSPQLHVLIEVDEYPFAHEAGVFIPDTNELFITSNQFSGPSGERKVQISKCVLDRSTGRMTREEISNELIQMANGGVNFHDGILFCAQGSMTAPSGLFRMASKPPYDTAPVVTSFLGRPFNSVNDVVVQSDGSIWFTDPIYGFEQGYRPPPSLPSQVYRYDPSSQGIRAMADGFGRPNGLCFSPDETTLYVTDTDRVHGDGSVDDSRVSSIYAFDIVQYHGQPSLVNRRLFAMADAGIPDGIKCDMTGNVYSGCGDGLNVWSPGGFLLGKILVDGGCANFCFGRDGEVFILNEHRLWRAQLAPTVKGALLKI
ncbi:hypothetical protein PFICI_06514 [Pestalotiopsis fici W106-1]|uniref:SMP-30/Gluconolactonase/LRE-like region domain-containing protein n=1 Tax=Pestalotiopsis fici (strain W106-1 / CGMCC3.15140) TaxID=1229662 RepID=W3X7Y5_PESFW|nr:uncharacterized protein PFICI_06514 [Pestalotiopsis fici W106-1]ETS81512.1 hypothetical protein PFICI_06514 [Pestalotiopsis fici W106-1]